MLYAKRPLKMRARLLYARLKVSGAPFNDIRSCTQDNNEKEQAESCTQNRPFFDENRLDKRREWQQGVVRKTPFGIGARPVVRKTM